MELLTRRRVISDKWIKAEGSAIQRFIRKPACPLSWVLPPLPLKEYRFVNYVLGFRVEATDDELQLIQKHDMFKQPFVQVRKDNPALPFALVLGPEWVADVQPSQTALLQTEGVLKEACVTWTMFFQSMSD